MNVCFWCYGKWLWVETVEHVHTTFQTAATLALSALDQVLCTCAGKRKKRFDEVLANMADLIQVFREVFGLQCRTYGCGFQNVAVSAWEH